MEGGTLGLGCDCKVGLLEWSHENNCLVVNNQRTIEDVTLS